jgi:phosphoserine phosphatase
VSAFPYRLVTLDLDGTLTLAHGWWSIANALGRSDQFERTQSEFRGGRIGEDQHIRNLLSIAEGTPVTQLVTILAETPKVEGIGPSVERLHALGARVALLTHNPGYVTGWYSRAYGFDGADGLTGSPPVVDGRIGRPVGSASDKLGGLRRLCERFRVGSFQVAHVGDGLADAAVFPRVGLGVAFRTQIPAVRAAADVTVEGSDLLPVVEVLGRTPPARS